jgi:hypothetical protein
MIDLALYLRMQIDCAGLEGHTFVRTADCQICKSGCTFDTQLTATLIQSTRTMERERQRHDEIERELVLPCPQSLWFECVSVFLTADCIV